MSDDWIQKMFGLKEIKKAQCLVIESFKFSGKT